MPPKPTGKTAEVHIEENEPVTHSPEERIAENEVLIAQNEGRMVQSRDETATEEGTVVTTHKRPGTLVMYKPTERSGYVPKRVSGSAVRLLLNQGWHKICPECNSRHVDKNGEDSTDPNLCDAREPLAVRICRVCDKRIYDNLGFANTDKEVGADDPNVIQDYDYTKTSPEQRTLASLNLHYWLRHPRQAQMMNLPPLPTALKELAESSGTG